MNRRLPCLLLVLSVVTTATAQEPELRLRRGMGADLVVELIPDDTAPMPAVFHLYRGDLDRLDEYQHVGGPDGRCDLPGTSSEAALIDELLSPTAHYYLLSSADAAGVETGLGTDSAGMERPNPSPCPPPMVSCGDEVVPVADITGTEGLAIGADGTVYYSQRGFVGRRPPGGTAEDRWVRLASAGTVWGMAVRESDRTLFVAAPDDNVYSIDLDAMTPTATVLYPSPGGSNGLIVGPDEAIYYSDFGGGRVYRVDDAGSRTEVTTSGVPGANGLLFDDDGTLIVLSYFTGNIWRLTLDATMTETDRVMLSGDGGNPDGIGKDEMGRYYVTDNGAGILLRFDDTWGMPEQLLFGVPAAANVAFGKGPLDCNDLYVASAGSLGFFEADATGRP
ncbi:MAG: SMP-30/gluconolactonase/LRE family protein [Acidobacteriota bacterium]